jgi:hypothetical protein
MYCFWREVRLSGNSSPWCWLRGRGVEQRGGLGRGLVGGSSSLLLLILYSPTSPVSIMRNECQAKIGLGGGGLIWREPRKVVHRCVSDSRAAQARFGQWAQRPPQPQAGIKANVDELAACMGQRGAAGVDVAKQLRVYRCELLAATHPFPARTRALQPKVVQIQQLSATSGPARAAAAARTAVPSTFRQVKQTQAASSAKCGLAAQTQRICGPRSPVQGRRSACNGDQPAPEPRFMLGSVCS